ncbi:MAG: 3-oxoacyl-[acyl-carrier-protein] synthase III C-terminal domain-containing protein, partial [Candidatus Levybacteria bacterium]|nr:3-oxoacyl-[acyl-carrier-protein] synthase III C-terminal domain-containing protein [Candidatus Levybacteria bacterium]
PLFMAIKASERALEGNKDKIHAVIVSTSFPTGENLSKKLQEKFGFSGFHLDVHAACSGVGVSLAYLKKCERQFTGKKILFVTTEKYSPYLQSLREEGGSTKDPSLSQTLFSDGATACTFEYGKDLKVLSAKRFVFPEDTKDYIKMPINKSLFVAPYLEIPIPYPSSGKFEQDGSRVYKLIRNNVPNLIRESIGKAGLTPADIKMVFLHQGSGHVVVGVNGQLPEFQGRILMDYQDGNNSSGSTPKSIMRAIREGGLSKHDIVNLTVFGAGLIAISTTLQL